MENEKDKKFPSIYIVAIMYVIISYVFPVIWYFVNVYMCHDGELTIIPLFLPIMFGAINLLMVIVGKENISTKQLINCALWVKCALIPFFVLGSICIVISIMMTFIPVVFMVLVGPLIALFLAFFGWTVVVGSAPFAIAYLVRLCKQGTYGKVLTIILSVLQFFFITDLVSVIIMAIKNRKINYDSH